MISVIIRNRGEYMTSCLMSVLRFIPAPQIIIVDDGCGFGVPIDDYTPGKALNLGVKEAKGEYILILSSHCVLTSFFESLEGMDLIDGVWGEQLPIYKGKRTTWRNNRTKTFHNALSFFKRKTLVEHPFDETLDSLEDKAWAKDKRVVHSTELSCDHHWTKEGATWK